MNNAERTRRELMIRFIREFFDGTLADSIDRIPVELRPRTEEPNRCCVYKDRAMLKYRLMALMGFGMEEEKDESRQLKEYLADAVDGRNHTGPVLSVCTVGCHGCVDSHVQVSNSCVGCFARPCVGVCPKQAIQVINQRSTIDRTKCINCGKCMTVCPYHAIIRNPLPCEDACPVGAIGKGEDGRVRIDFKNCIYCGKCFRACPFSAIMERSQLANILTAMKSGRPVVAMVAPSVSDQFPGTIEQLFTGLRKAGFTEILEVALGAEMTTEHEAEEFYERMERGNRPADDQQLLPGLGGSRQTPHPGHRADGLLHAESNGLCRAARPRKISGCADRLHRPVHRQAPRGPERPEHRLRDDFRGTRRAVRRPRNRPDFP